MRLNLGVRSKLFAISFALIAIVGLASGLYAQSKLRHWLENRIESELVREARAAREQVQGRALTLDQADQLADRLAAALESRVTVIAPDGRVLGDSDLDPAAILTIDNHGARPEVKAALAKGRGQSRRHSATLRTDMLYVAVPYQAPGGAGVVRLARPLAEVDAAVGRLRTALLLAGVLGLIIAVLMSALASHLMSRTLRRLAESARTIARGTRDDDERPPLDVERSDELGRLAGSISRMANRIETTIEALASERSRFEAVLEGMSEAVIAIDERRRIRLMNTAARTLLRLVETPENDLLLEHLRAPAVDELLTQPIEPGSCEFDLPSNRERRMLARVSPERAGTGCIIVMYDVTDLRHLMTVRRDFVANVSHELRTPISVIQANAETLIDGAASDPVHGPRLLEALYRNAQRMSSIISDLLVLSRIESGHQSIDMHPVSVTQAVRRALESVQDKARERDIELDIDVPDDLMVHADENALDHILVNYLDNAIKYTEPGGHVRLANRITDQGVRIEVIDDGPGIAPHLSERIFERFFRVDAGRSRDMGGTGLGLSIVKHLAHAMGGAVGVEPVPPHGCCFYLSLRAV